MSSTSLLTIFSHNCPNDFHNYPFPMTVSILKPRPPWFISLFSPKKGKQNLSPLSSEDVLLGHCFYFNIKAPEKESTFLNKPPPCTKITPKMQENSITVRLETLTAEGSAALTRSSLPHQTHTPLSCKTSLDHTKSKLSKPTNHVCWHPYRNFLITRNGAKTLSLPISAPFMKSDFFPLPWEEPHLLPTPLCRSSVIYSVCEVFYADVWSQFEQLSNLCSPSQVSRLVGIPPEPRRTHPPQDARYLVPKQEQSWSRH